MDVKWLLDRVKKPSHLSAVANVNCVSKSIQILKKISIAKHHLHSALGWGWGRGCCCCCCFWVIWHWIPVLLPKICPISFRFNLIYIFAKNYPEEIHTNIFVDMKGYLSVGSPRAVWGWVGLSRTESDWVCGCGFPTYS